MILDGAGPAAQLQDLFIVQYQAAALLLGDLDVAGGLVALAVDDLLLLRAQAFLHDGAQAILFEQGLEHAVLVGVHRAAHHVLAQPPGGVDQDDVGKAGLGIEGEHHPGAGPVRPHHLLYADG